MTEKVQEGRRLKEDEEKEKNIDEGWCERTVRGAGEGCGRRQMQMWGRTHKRIS